MSQPPPEPDKLTTLLNELDDVIEEFVQVKKLTKKQDDVMWKVIDAVVALRKFIDPNYR